MDFSHSTILFSLTIFLLLLPCSKPVSDYSTLVYKTCANHTFNNQLSPQSYSQTLSSLFQQLIAQSSQSKFFKTNEAVNDDTTIISGHFQCRDDMSNEDCFRCVILLPQISKTLCSDSVSARVQLDGCYVQYKTEELIPETETIGEDESPKLSSSNLLHKECGRPVVAPYFFKFKELMEEAFLSLESGILNSNGYYRTNYKSVKLMAQCEGDSETCECRECVSDAVQVAKEECATSLSAQVYLDKCFISYIYQPQSESNNVPGSSSNNNTEKLAAIVVGGAAALFLGFILLSLVNSRLKNDEYE